MVDDAEAVLYLLTGLCFEYEWKAACRHAQNPVCPALGPHLCVKLVDITIQGFDDLVKCRVLQQQHPQQVVEATLQRGLLCPGCIGQHQLLLLVCKACSHQRSTKHGVQLRCGTIIDCAHRFGCASAV